MNAPLFQHATHHSQFMPSCELKAVFNALRSEDGPGIRARLHEVQRIIDTMPRTYGQDGKGDQAIAYLHYFRGSGDWYITELDLEPEQHQAFGLVDLGFGPELGYISIIELVECNVELDLYWTPKTLAEIKAEKAGK